jgi:hypothetical protein
LWWLRSNGLAVIVSWSPKLWPQKTACIKSNSPWPSTQKPACLLT